MFTPIFIYLYVLNKKYELVTKQFRNVGRSVSWCVGMSLFPKFATFHWITP